MLKVVGQAAPFLLALVLLLPGGAFAETLKVLDWNTHHGVGSDGVYNLQRLVAWIARSGANVVSLNEVEKNNGWGNEDQPARYAALLTAATGKTWYHTFAQRDGGGNGQGNAILSTFPFEATGARTLSYSRSVARAQIVVGGVRVNIFSTHLDADSSSRRATQMAELRSWSSNYSQQHVIAGDFNAWPGAAEIANMTAFSHDGWAEAKTRGLATAYEGNPAGNTRSSRIDYIWYSKKSTQLVLKRAQVLDTRDASGVTPSDHRPVMVTFEVGSASSPTSVRAAADLTVFRPSNGTWYVRRSSSGFTYTDAVVLQWGLSTDKPVSGDFDGDGRLDLVVYRPSGGEWFIRYSTRGYSYAYDWFQWGVSTDIPFASDFDGDGRSDLVVYRPSTGEWYVRNSSANYGAFVVYQWGLSTDIPVPSDFDGDGRCDLAVYRPSTGEWYVRFSARNFSARQPGIYQWGLNGDIPLATDFDGDGMTDLAIYRPSNGYWHIRYSGTSYSTAAAYQWGLPTDTPVSADFDGDGRTDLGVYRPANGQWLIRYSSRAYNYAYAVYQWGLAGDVPIVPQVR